MASQTIEKKRVALSADYDGSVAATAMDQAVMVNNHVLDALHRKIAYSVLAKKCEFQEQLPLIIKFSPEDFSQVSVEMQAYFQEIEKAAYQAAELKIPELLKDAVKKDLRASSESLIALIEKTMFDFFDKKQLSKEISQAIYCLLAPQTVFATVEGKLYEAIDDACDKGILQLSSDSSQEQHIECLLFSMNRSFSSAFLKVVEKIILKESTAGIVDHLKEQGYRRFHQLLSEKNIIPSQLMIGSNRQSFLMDRRNNGKNNNGFCFIEMPKLAGILQVSFNPFLLADLENNQPPGWEFKMRKAGELSVDPLKIKLILAQLHQLASEENSPIEFHFMDDRKDVLSMLYYVLSIHKDMVPKNSCVHLHVFDGVHIQSFAKSIQGAGANIPYNELNGRISTFYEKFEYCFDGVSQLYEKMSKPIYAHLAVPPRGSESPQQQDRVNARLKRRKIKYLEQAINLHRMQNIAQQMRRLYIFLLEDSIYLEKKDKKLLSMLIESLVKYHDCMSGNRNDLQFTDEMQLVHLFVLQNTLSHFSSRVLLKESEITKEIIFSFEFSKKNDLVGRMKKLINHVSLANQATRDSYYLSFEESRELVEAFKQGACSNFKMISSKVKQDKQDKQILELLYIELMHQQQFTQVGVETIQLYAEILKKGIDWSGLVRSSIQQTQPFSPKPGTSSGQLSRKGAGLFRGLMPHSVSNRMSRSQSDTPLKKSVTSSKFSYEILSTVHQLKQLQIIFSNEENLKTARQELVILYQQKQSSFINLTEHSSECSKATIFLDYNARQLVTMFRSLAIKPEFENVPPLLVKRLKGIQAIREQHLKIEIENLLYEPQGHELFLNLNKAIKENKSFKGFLEKTPLELLCDIQKQKMLTPLLGELFRTLGTKELLLKKLESPPAFSLMNSTDDDVSSSPIPSCSSHQ